jgi:hypothetical protein
MSSTRPHDSDSETDSVWRELTVVPEDAEARLIEGWLESEGIECQLESLVFTQEPVQFGLLGGVRVHVHAVDHERAAEMLDRLEAAPAEDAPEELAGGPPERTGSTGGPDERNGSS